MPTDKTYDKWLEERQQRRKGIIKLETLESKPALVGDSKKSRTQIDPYEIPDSLTPDSIPPSLQEFKDYRDEKISQYRTLLADHESPEEEKIPSTESADLYKEFKAWGEYLNSVCSMIKSGEVPEALKEIDSVRDDLNELIETEDAPENLKNSVHKLLTSEDAIHNAYESAIMYLDQQFSLDLAESIEELKESFLLRYKNIQEAANNIDLFGSALEILDEDALNSYDTIQNQLGFNYLIKNDPLDVLQEILGNALALLDEDVGNYQSSFFLEHIFLPLCKEQGFTDEVIEKLVNNADISELLVSNTNLNYYDDGTQELEINDSSHEAIGQLMEERDLETHDLIELVELENYPDELASKYMITLENIYKKHLELVNNVYENLIEDIHKKVDGLVSDITSYIDGYAF
jgi:hypothetical protein